MESLRAWYTDCMQKRKIGMGRQTMGISHGEAFGWINLEILKTHRQTPAHLHPSIIDASDAEAVESWTRIGVTPAFPLGKGDRAGLGRRGHMTSNRPPDEKEDQRQRRNRNSPDKEKDASKGVITDRSPGKLWTKEWPKQSWCPISVTVEIIATENASVSMDSRA